MNIQNIQQKVNANMVHQYDYFIDFLSSNEKRGLTQQDSIDILKKLRLYYLQPRCGMCESGYKCDKHS